MREEVVSTIMIRLNMGSFFSFHPPWTPPQNFLRLLLGLSSLAGLLPVPDVGPVIFPPPFGDRTAHAVSLLRNHHIEVRRGTMRWGRFSLEIWMDLVIATLAEA